MSTFFPYTTLFRSTPSVDKQASHFVHIPGLSYSGVKSPTECQQSLFESHFASRQDRKSGSAGMPRPISYAVFCLKKKKSYEYEHTCANKVSISLTMTNDENVH